MKADEIRDLARQFHVHYESLAPRFGYATRQDTKVFDPNSPNGLLMQQVIREIVAPRVENAERRLAEIAQIIERRHCDPSIANAPSLRDFSGGIPENETERIYRLAKGTEK